MLNYEACMGELTRLCLDLKLTCNPYAILSDNTRLYEVSVPRTKMDANSSVLIVGRSEIAPHSIMRFLSKVPTSYYSHLTLDILPLVNPLGITLEKVLVYRLIDKREYSLILTINEDYKTLDFYLERDSKSAEHSQRVLDTASTFFSLDYPPERIIKIEQDTSSKTTSIEYFMNKHKGTPFISIYIPGQFNSSDKVVCTSRIIEDVLNENLYYRGRMLRSLRKKLFGTK